MADKATPAQQHRDESLTEAMNAPAKERAPRSPLEFVNQQMAKAEAEAKAKAAKAKAKRANKVTSRP